MPLAKISDIKTRLGILSSDSDDLLAALLAEASSLAEQLVGVGEGQLSRRTGIVEFPSSDYGRGSMLRLSCRPVEFVSSVKALSSAGTDADFAAADELVRDQDYNAVLRMGVLKRIGDQWTLDDRCNQVIYSAGFLDPDAAGGVDAWATSHSYAVGDLVTVNQNVYACITAHASTSGNAPEIWNAWANSESAVWTLVNQVPRDLQAGVIQQTIRNFQTKDTGGLVGTVNVGQGGSFSPESTAHPVLVAACRAWRVYA